jgi:hypothetical protein
MVGEKAVTQNEHQKKSRRLAIKSHGHRALGNLLGNLNQAWRWKMMHKGSEVESLGSIVFSSTLKSWHWKPLIGLKFGVEVRDQFLS